MFPVILALCFTLKKLILHINVHPLDSRHQRSGVIPSSNVGWIEMPDQLPESLDKKVASKLLIVSSGNKTAKVATLQASWIGGGATQLLRKTGDRIGL